MLHVLFDYGLNVKLCVAAGAAQTVTWAVWALRRRHPGRGRMLLFLVRASLSTTGCSGYLTLAQSLLTLSCEVHGFHSMLASNVFDC